MWRNRGDSLRSATEVFEPSCGCRQLQEHLVHAVEKNHIMCGHFWPCMDTSCDLGLYFYRWEALQLYFQNNPSLDF